MNGAATLRESRRAQAFARIRSIMESTPGDTWRDTAALARYRGFKATTPAAASVEYFSQLRGALLGEFTN